MSKASLLSWIPGYCTPVVYKENGIVYQAAPCDCPGVECPGSTGPTYPDLSVIAAALMIVVLIALWAKQRARKRAGIARS